MTEEKYICPVCNYLGLDEEPYNKFGNASFEICFCCGYEFGYHDGSMKISHKKYREKWIADGTQWFYKELKPKNWKIDEQLEGFKKV